MIRLARGLVAFTLLVSAAFVVHSDEPRAVDAHVQPGEYALSVDGQYHAPVGGSVELIFAVDHPFTPSACIPLAHPPTPGCYAVLDFQLLYDATTLQTSSSAMMRDPMAPARCAARATRPLEDGTTWRAIAGCVDLEGAMTYAGPVWHLTFTCVGPGSQTLLFDVVQGRTFVGALEGITLPSHVHDGWRVTCSDLVPMGDEDADGCFNDREWAPDPTTGGDRDHLDFWDFYDVTGDRSVDLADTLLLLDRYGRLPGDPGYDALLDRHAPLATKPWRSAASNDGIDLIDALTSLKSFGHDCSN